MRCLCCVVGRFEVRFDGTRAWMEHLRSGFLVGKGLQGDCLDTHTSCGSGWPVKANGMRRQWTLETRFRPFELLNC